MVPAKVRRDSRTGKRWTFGGGSRSAVDCPFPALVVGERVSFDWRPLPPVVGAPKTIVNIGGVRHRSIDPGLIIAIVASVMLLASGLLIGGLKSRRTHESAQGAPPVLVG